MKILIEDIISQLKEIQGGNIWVGETFDKKLSQIHGNEVFVRPVPYLHSVAEIISHLTVWRKETILKIRTGKGSITDDSEENWFPNAKLRKIGWDEIISQYRGSLSELIELLQMKDDDFLKLKYYDADFKGYFEYRFVIYGMIHHDLYHLGQLGIIIKFLKKKIK